jgi:hypothetical protein
MSLIALLICQSLFAQEPAAKIDPDHAANSIYNEIRTTGFRAEGTVARAADPLLHDGMSAEEQHAALLKLRESTRALEVFLARGITAPIEFKLHDQPGTTGTIREYDIWFVVYATLDEIKPEELSGQAKEGGAGDTEGMRFEGRLITDDDLKTLGIVPTGKLDQYARAESQLLDKVEVKATNRSLTTRGTSSVVVGTRTVPDLDRFEAFRNVWRTLDLRGGMAKYGPWEPYAGVAAYVKATRLEFRPDALLVEIHGVYAEPKGWFKGRSYLKTKIPSAADQRVRELRREIAKRRQKAAGPAS